MLKSDRQKIGQFMATLDYEDRERFCTYLPVLSADEALDIAKAYMDVWCALPIAERPKERPLEVAVAPQLSELDLYLKTHRLHTGLGSLGYWVPVKKRNSPKESYALPDELKLRILKRCDELNIEYRGFVDGFSEKWGLVWLLVHTNPGLKCNDILNYWDSVGGYSNWKKVHLAKQGASNA